MGQKENKCKGLKRQYRTHFQLLNVTLKQTRLCRAIYQPDHAIQKFLRMFRTTEQENWSGITFNIKEPVETE